MNGSISGSVGQLGSRFARAPSRWVLVLVLGLALGLTGLLLEHAPEPLSRLSALGSPWLIVAFVAGAVVSRVLPGAAAGSMALVLATIAYYVAKPIIGSPINPPQYDTPLFWLVVALPAGGVTGALGATSTWRSARARVLAVSLLGAMVVTETWLRSADSSALLVLGTAVGALWPVVWLRQWAHGLAGLLVTVALAAPLWVLAQYVAPLVVMFR